MFSCETFEEGSPLLFYWILQQLCLLLKLKAFILDKKVCYASIFAGSMVEWLWILVTTNLRH